MELVLTPGEVCGPVASASTGSFLEIKILRLWPRSAESESPGGGVRPRRLGLNKPSRVIVLVLEFETHC